LTASFLRKETDTTLISSRYNSDFKNSAVSGLIMTEHSDGNTLCPLPLPFVTVLPNRPTRSLGWFGAASLLLLLTLASSPLSAQTKVEVSVDTTQTRALVYTTTFGVVAERWDKVAYDADTMKLLQDAGITNMRFPGGGGIDALYHWSTGTIVNPYTNDRAPAFPKERMFPAMVPIIDQLGSALITVNYGTNADATGGGEPAEAAAWVAYANGDPSNTQPIGKDSKGNDWKTVGFWAGLRAATPLATDDGYNRLRIGHAAPIGIPLWTIGSDPWNNGFYGQDRTMGSDADNEGKYGQSPPPEPDLHAGKVPGSKEWGRHQGNEKVGPATYGAAVVEYVKAMKAVDPKILIGAYVVKPPFVSDANQMGKKWNAQMLKAACGSVDFVATSFWEGRAQMHGTTDVIDEQDLLSNMIDPGDPSRSRFPVSGLNYDFSDLGHDLLDNYKKYCPANHRPPLAVTGLGISSWLNANNPSALAMFSADAVASLIERGAYTVEWEPIHALSPSFLDYKNQPQPAYYGIKLLHQIAAVGDTFVNTTSSQGTLIVHATKRRDGGLGLLFINHDIIHPAAATVTINGYSYATKGTRYDYGKSTIEAGKQGLVESSVDNLGGTFTVEVPRYSMVAIVIPKQ
jgi:hypothetical protein